VLLGGWTQSNQKSGQIPQGMLLKVSTSGLETGSVQTNRALKLVQSKQTEH